MKKGIFSATVVLVVVVLAIWGNSGSDEKKKNNEPKTEQSSDSKPQNKPQNNSTEKKESSDKITYNQQVSQSVYRINYILQDLGDHLSNAQVDSESWMNKMNQYISELKKAIADSEKIKPKTSEEKNTDGVYRMGVKDINWVAKNLPKAIKNNDDDLLYQATDYLKKATEEFKATLSMVN
ncbi:hypothetical protein [Sporolactobacillus terrae]|uniref:Uncharacterized protein n=1 Tax=Sporolactobacillus terrae TaxID=269673 RepID=A0A5K7WYN5_9BACL|nr:hypothetical protein [Sporolactobacillus terrae]BBN97453.1 hypothetical protein St703_01580 [Sporolactobacillus terrae]